MPKAVNMNSLIKWFQVWFVTQAAKFLLNWTIIKIAINYSINIKMYPSTNDLFFLWRKIFEEFRNKSDISFSKTRSICCELLRLGIWEENLHSHLSRFYLNITLSRQLNSDEMWSKPAKRFDYNPQRPHKEFFFRFMLAMLQSLIESWKI